MFNSISGTITAKMPNEVFLENNGVEWAFFVSTLAVDSFGPVGSEARVYAWLYHREDQMRLFGFSSSRERDVFTDLMKVEGIGPKQAIKILSTISVDELEAALDTEDIEKLESAPGIGKKTAQKMILSLKGKLTRIDTRPSSKASQVPAEHEDIVAALAGMGFDRKAAIDAVARLAVELDAERRASGAAFGKTGTSASGASTPAGKKAAEQELFRRAIVALSS